MKTKQTSSLFMTKLSKNLLLAVLLFISSSLRAEEMQPPAPVVILGGGIGALTSAVYLARGGITPIVIEGKEPGGAITQSPKVQNWPGELEISGFDLIEKVHAQAEKNGALFLNEEVVSVDFSQRPFLITTHDLHDNKTKTLKAYSCIIALGAVPRSLGVPGESLYWSKGVYSCAVCDGALYKDKTVAIVGGGDSALIEAEYLANIAKKVYVIVRKGSFRSVEKQRENEVLAKDNIEVLFETEIKKIQGDGDKVTQVLVQQTSSSEQRPIQLDAVFLALGAVPNTQFFAKQLELDDNGYILLKHGNETSIPGVYAIGDVADPIYKQAISAAGDGAKAALQAHDYLMAQIKPALKTAHMALNNPSQASKKAPDFQGIIEITSREQFEKEIKESTLPVCVDFYATWCGPCRALNPELEKKAKKLHGKVKFLKVNVQTMEELASFYGVRAMPTMVAFDSKGSPIAKKVGGRDILDYINTLK